MHSLHRCLANLSPTKPTAQYSGSYAFAQAWTQNATLPIPPGLVGLLISRDWGRLMGKCKRPADGPPMLINHMIALFPEIWIVGNDHVEGAMEQWAARNESLKFRQHPLIHIPADNAAEVTIVIQAIIDATKATTTNPRAVIISSGQNDLLNLTTAALRAQFEKTILACERMMQPQRRNNKQFLGIIVTPIQPQLLYPTYNKQSAARRKLSNINRKIAAVASISGNAIASPAEIKHQEEKWFHPTKLQQLSTAGHQAVASAWHYELTRLATAQSPSVWDRLSEM